MCICGCFSPYAIKYFSVYIILCFLDTQRCYSNCVSRTSCMGISWGIVSNAESWAPPRSTDPQSDSDSTQLYLIPSDMYAHSSVRNSAIFLHTEIS